MINVKSIAVHMDAFNHWMHSKAMVREFVKEKKIEDKVFIPDDGEKIKLSYKRINLLFSIWNWL